MDVDLPLLEDPADSDSESDSGSTNGINTLDEETDEAQLGMLSITIRSKWLRLNHPFRMDDEKMVSIGICILSPSPHD